MKKARLRMRLNRSVNLGAWIAAALLSSPAIAARVEGIQAATLRPVIPRGGVMMLPLTAERHGTHWPATLKLSSKNGPDLAGQVAWVHPVPEPVERRWTDDPRLLGIRAVEPSDDSSRLEANASVGPYLLARVPLEFPQADLQLGRQVITPIWCNMAREDEELPMLSAEAGGPHLERRAAPDRPDADSPFEYWRWVMLADRLKLPPPPPPGDVIQQLAAEHYAALWRMGLTRLAQQSPRIAEQCRDLLTQTCIDQRQSFAVWLCDPLPIGQLLAILLDPSRSGPEVLSQAVAWIDDQQPLVLWLESEDSERVRVIAANALTEPLTARVEWFGSGEPAVAMRIEPGVLNAFSFDRAALPHAPLGLPVPAEPARQVLSIDVGGNRFDAAVGARAAAARPPGVFLRPLSPPLTLFEIQSRVLRTISDDRATLAQVRRLGGRWELFFECRRPQPDASTTSQPAPEPESTLGGDASLDQLRGLEAVSFILGPEEHEGGPTVWVTIPENGWPRIHRGYNDGTMQVHKRSLGDRWFCRVVLPEAWCAFDAAARLGFIRGHGDSKQIETGPHTSLPWRQLPGRVAIDLSKWDDLPTE